jgi:hypothetical protein
MWQALRRLMLAVILPVAWAVVLAAVTAAEQALTRAGALNIQLKDGSLGQAKSEPLAPELLLRSRRQPPANGWRRFLYQATAGRVSPGELAAELKRRELTAGEWLKACGGLVWRRTFLRATWVMWTS